MQEPLILGIDPGTTVGYALLDINGNVLAVKSKKGISLGALIFFVIKYGQPLVVGTDVKPAPSFVRSFSSKLGATLIEPDYSLKVSEKRALTRGFTVHNMHEMDSLACALYAYKQCSDTIRSVERRLLKLHKSYLFFDAVSLILRKKKITLEEAIRELEPEEKVEGTKTLPKLDMDISSLLKKMGYVSEENANLKRSLDFFRAMKMRKVVVPNLMTDERARLNIMIKEKRNASLSRQILELDQEKKELLQRIED